MTNETVTIKCEPCEGNEAGEVVINKCDFDSARHTLAGCVGPVPPADVPPADVPPADVPPADVPPAEVPPADVPLAEVPLAEVPPAEVPPVEPQQTTRAGRRGR
jgi:hypothetical protein